MSNDVRGYIDYIEDYNLSALIILLEDKYNIGIEEIEKDKLYNFPSATVANNQRKRFIFNIVDDNEYYCASFLIDYINYAPEADIGFPIEGKKRLNILLDVMSEIIEITKASKMVIAITDSCQIETIKKIKFAEMRDIIHVDFTKYQALPNTLYEIICE